MPSNKMIQKDDLVQIINEEDKWYPAILVVSEVKSWGIQGYTMMPLQGNAYYRVKFEDLEFVGRAKIIAE